LQLKLVHAPEPFAQALPVAAVDLSHPLIDRLDVTAIVARSVMENGQYICFTRARVSPIFVAAFSHTLKQFKQTGAFQAIRHKYLP
jgi:polar amino acid transport system substrate-binding protein